MKKLQSVGLKSNIKTHENNKEIVCRSEDQLNYSLGKLYVYEVLYIFITNII